MATLSIATIRALQPTSVANMPDATLTEYINIVQDVVDKATDNMFNTSVVAESDIINYQTDNTYGTQFVPIGAWQATGLTIKIVDSDEIETASPTATALVLGSDYTLHYGKTGRKSPGESLPVTAINLTCERLGNSQALRVYGTYGWFAASQDSKYPADLQGAMAKVVANMATYAQSKASQGGLGGITKLKDVSTEIERGDAFNNQLEDLQGSPLADPVFAEVLHSYIVTTQETMSVI